MYDINTGKIPTLLVQYFLVNGTGSSLSLIHYLDLKITSERPKSRTQELGMTEDPTVLFEGNLESFVIPDRRETGTLMYRLGVTSKLFRMVPLGPEVPSHYIVICGDY